MFDGDVVMVLFKFEDVIVKYMEVQMFDLFQVVLKIKIVEVQKKIDVVKVNVDKEVKYVVVFVVGIVVMEVKNYVEVKMKLQEVIIIDGVRLEVKVKMIEFDGILVV